MSKQPTQLPSSTPQSCRRKRKGKNDNNDEDVAIITNTTITTTAPSVTQSMVT